jgi:hypothetical protein
MVCGIVAADEKHKIFVLNSQRTFLSLSLILAAEIAAGSGQIDSAPKPLSRRDFPQPSSSALESTQPPAQRMPGLFSGLNWLGRDVDHPHLLVPTLKKGYSYSIVKPSFSFYPRFPCVTTSIFSNNK